MVVDAPRGAPGARGWSAQSGRDCEVVVGFIASKCPRFPSGLQTLVRMYIKSLDACKRWSHRWVLASGL
jgi:hypothetical protein